MSTHVAAVVKSTLLFGEEVGSAGSIETFRPADPTHFGVSVQIFIGHEADDASDSFDLVVCSPSWFAARVADGAWDRFRAGGLTALPMSVAVGSGIWFMRHCDQTEFESALRVVCESASPGPDWGTVAYRIGRLIPWEFDYKYDAHVDQRYGEPFPPTRPVLARHNPAV